MFPWAGVLLVLVLFTYAVTGMQVFGQIMVESIDQVEVTAIHQYNNFENFGQAMLVMIRCFTGENWQRIMLGCVDAECNENSIMNSTTCGNPVTYVFFPSFFFIGSILVLNIFVAIIIDNFDYYLRDKSILGSHHLTDFPSLWAKFDPMSTGKIHHTDVIRMMRSLNPPMGWGKLCPQLTAYKRMMRLNIPLSEDGMVTFNATLFAIVRQSLTIELQGEPSQVNIELKNKLKDLFPRVPKKMLDNVIPERAEDSTGRQYAAIIIQHQWRQIKLKRDRFKLYRKPSSMAFRYVPEIGRDLVQRHQTSLNLDAVLQDYSPNSSPELIHAEVHNGTYNSTPPRRQSTTSLRNSFLIRLDTIEEQNDMEESQHALNNSPPPSPDSSPPFPKETQQINLVSYPKRRQSIVSESDLFATPTGSVTSLNIQDDDPPKSKQSVHSNAFVETPV